MTEILNKELIYTKRLYKLEVLIGDKTYVATIIDEADDISGEIFIHILKDGFGNRIRNWSDEIEGEIVEAYLEN